MEHNIKDRIYAAIALFVEDGGIQTKVILSRVDYKSLLREANSTVLGCSFLKAGFRFCDLAVFSYSGDDIVIA